MKLRPEYVEKLNKIFNQVAGQKIEFTAETKTHNGKTYTQLTPVDANGPTLSALFKEAGSNVAFILKDDGYVAGAQATFPALQAFVEKDEGGNYRLTKNWSLGMKSEPWL
jgi:hypothetical protein